MRTPGERDSGQNPGAIEHPIPPGLTVLDGKPPCQSIGPICYTMNLPAALVLFTANERPHWSRRAAVTGAIRIAASTLARTGKIPPLTQAWITVVLYPHNRRRLDPHNWAPRRRRRSTAW